MFGKSFTLFRVAGFDVRINLTWLFLALLIAWSLADGYFPALYEGWPKQTYWWAAVAGVIGLLFSIVAHELSHSLVARSYGLPMGGITLFLFGGVAHMEQEPASPKIEFLMALAGPACSLVLAGLFFAAAAWLRLLSAGEPVIAVTEYLSALNLILAIFNLVPAFPLDGGRALRAIMWRTTGDFGKATRWSARIGSLFGLFLIVMGLVWLFQGQFIGGLWWFLLGMFLRAAALSSYYQLEVEQLLAGRTVRTFMTDGRSAVPSDLSIEALVDRKVYEYYQDLFAVVDEGRLVGCVSINEIKSVPKDQWKAVTVAEIMVECDEKRVIDPDEDGVEALRRLGQTGSNWLIVAQGSDFVGMVSGRDLLNYISLKISLGGNRSGRAAITDPGHAR